MKTPKTEQGGAPAAAPTDFIREAVKEDLRDRAVRPRPHALPAGAERLSAHRPRQGGLDRLRHRAGVRRPVQPALRRHQPGQGRAGVRRRHHRGRPLARRRLGRPAVLRLATTSSRCTSGPMELIRKGKAYVCDLTADEVSAHRGTLTQPGKDSPYRNRSVEENLDLFARMRAGEFPDGSRTLRAKIDMAAPEPEHARPGHVPHPARRAPPPGRQVVHLPDVRLGARAGGFHRGRSRTRSARWSTRTTARCTTGSSTSSASTTRGRSSSRG